MGWLRRLRGEPGEQVSPAPRERFAPALAALFAGIADPGPHSVLDLGPATDSSLQIYARFARRVRFADLAAPAESPEAWRRALDALPSQPDQPYDLVFAWDIFDRLDVADRRALVDRLIELTVPQARLHLVVGGSERGMMEPLRFTLCDVDRVRYERSGPDRPAFPPLLPLSVERVLAPFEVVRGFTLKVGVREYLAVRR